MSWMEGRNEEWAKRWVSKWNQEKGETKNKQKSNKQWSRERRDEYGTFQKTILNYKRTKREAK